MSHGHFLFVPPWVGQGGVERGFVLFEVRNELFADCDHRLEQRLADLVADEQIGGVDDVAVAGAVRILERDAAMGQSVGGDHTLIISIVLVEAGQSGEQGEAKLL